MEFLKRNNMEWKIYSCRPNNSQIDKRLDSFCKLNYNHCGECLFSDKLILWQNGSAEGDKSFQSISLSGGTFIILGNEKEIFV